MRSLPRAWADSGKRGSCYRERSPKYSSACTHRPTTPREFDDGSASVGRSKQRPRSNVRPTCQHEGRLSPAEPREQQPAAHVFGRATSLNAYADPSSVIGCMSTGRSRKPAPGFVLANLTRPEGSLAMIARSIAPETMTESTKSH